MKDEPIEALLEGEELQTWIEELLDEELLEVSDARRRYTGQTLHKDAKGRRVRPAFSIWQQPTNQRKAPRWAPR
jgi:hypothetical protein